MGSPGLRREREQAVLALRQYRSPVPTAWEVLASLPLLRLGVEGPCCHLKKSHALASVLARGLVPEQELEQELEVRQLAPVEAQLQQEPALGLRAPAGLVLALRQGA